MTEPLSQTESALQAFLQAGNLEKAAALTLQAYGPELLGFLISQLSSQQHAEDVFSMFAEDFWRSLPSLSLRTSMRAWVYALARNAKNRFLERELRRQRKGVPLSQAHELGQLIEAARTQTVPFLATAAKDRFAALRERLSDDELTLLTLRVDRRLAWREIAEALGDAGDLTRAAARQRKRFQLLKDKLARWAREDGLISKCRGAPAPTDSELSQPAE